MPDLESLSYGGKTYVRAEAPRGKKAAQVAGMIKTLQEHPGVPYEFEALCTSVGQKYPQDVQAGMLALEMCEFIDRYNTSTDVGQRSPVYYVWTGPTIPKEFPEGVEDHEPEGENVADAA